ncbi:MAG: hypothetical protein Tsb0020_50730 [Haliangiales bacterium]
MRTTPIATLVWAALLAGLGACGGEVENDIALAITAPECASDDLARVRYVTVELYGIDDRAPCALARRCVPVDSQTIDDMLVTLAGAPQPLIDVTDPDAHIVAVIGHETGCLADDDRVMCGETDLANRERGVLGVSLECGGCGDAAIPFCP